MAQLARKFDPTSSEHNTEQRDYANLPNGIYELEVEASKPSEKNSDTYFRLEVVYNVRRPEEFEGRKIFSGFNLVHTNSTAEKISNDEFASLCRAIGHTGAVEDSEELHLTPFIAKVALGKPSKDGQYPAKSEIKKYFFPDQGDLPEPEIDAQQPSPAANDNKPATRTPAATPAKAAAGGRTPWGSKK